MASAQVSTVGPHDWAWVIPKLGMRDDDVILHSRMPSFGFKLSHVQVFASQISLELTLASTFQDAQLKDSTILLQQLQIERLQDERDELLQALSAIKSQAIASAVVTAAGVLPVVESAPRLQLPTTMASSPSSPFGTMRRVLSFNRSRSTSNLAEAGVRAMRWKEDDALDSVVHGGVPLSPPSVMAFDGSDDCQNPMMHLSRVPGG